MGLGLLAFVDLRILRALRGSFFTGERFEQIPVGGEIFKRQPAPQSLRVPVAAMRDKTFVPPSLYRAAFYTGPPARAIKLQGRDVMLDLRIKSRHTLGARFLALAHQR
jgi:hypothetical protein